MTNREFVIWLSGFFELLGGEPRLTKHQLYMINNHLNLAEAVEGGLGEFNLEIREIITAELSNCETSEPSDHINDDISALLHDKILNQIKSF